MVASVPHHFHLLLSLYMNHFLPTPPARFLSNNNTQTLLRHLTFMYIYIYKHIYIYYYRPTYIFIKYYKYDTRKKRHDLHKILKNKYWKSWKKRFKMYIFKYISLPLKFEMIWAHSLFSFYLEPTRIPFGLRIQIVNTIKLRIIVNWNMFSADSYILNFKPFWWITRICDRYNDHHYYYTIALCSYKKCSVTMLQVYNDNKNTIIFIKLQIIVSNIDVS